MKRILVVTSGRADASPLRPVIEALEEGGFKGVRCELDGLDPNEEAPHLPTQGIDCLLCLGDRYETLAACLAATHARIPIAHIHGGEASFGSFDNQIRDAITKLAHIHFVAAEPMRERLLALGEEPHRIHVVGAPGLDNVAEALKIPRCRENILLVTQHPVTLGQDKPRELVKALSRFKDQFIHWTGTNNDPGSEAIRDVWGDDPFAKNKVSYLEICRHAAVIVGNSSSGIIEAPYLEVPTVNIGSRQDGRLKGRSIIDCAEDADAIEQAILNALKYDGPYNRLYGEPGASRKIADILKDWQPDMVKKWVS